jgi:hypothetical protein
MSIQATFVRFCRRVVGRGGSGGGGRGPYLGSGKKHQRMNGYPVNMNTNRKRKAAIGNLHSRYYSRICNMLEGGGLG